MANEKYALLDTDFISKMHLIRKDDQNKLIDKIMVMPNYTFYCHEQISVELLRHNTVGPLEWFKGKVKSKLIYLYNDEMILDELTAIYGDLALAMYVDMLKTACDAYKDGYFEENFTEMSKINALYVGRTEFLEKLTLDCETIGAGKNLGELKSYVLLQALNMKFGQRVYVFCSDDKNKPDLATPYKIAYLKKLIKNNEVYKFISFQKNAETKFKTLKEGKIWFSFYKTLNDETEFQIDYRIKKIVNETGYKKGYIELLKEFFYGKYVSEITIYYHNQYAYEQLVISLVNMLGKEFVIEQTGSNRIKFIRLDSPIKVSVENEMIF